MLHRTIQSEYDLAERPVQLTQRNSTGALQYRTTLHYDGQNRLDRLTERVGTTDYRTTYWYDDDSRITGITCGNDSRTIEYTYDDLGRIATRKATNGTAYNTAYAYVTDTTDTKKTSPGRHGDGSCV